MNKVISGKTNLATSVSNVFNVSNITLPYIIIYYTYKILVNRRNVKKLLNLLIFSYILKIQ